MQPTIKTWPNNESTAPVVTLSSRLPHSGVIVPVSPFGKRRNIINGGQSGPRLKSSVVKSCLISTVPAKYCKINNCFYLKKPVMKVQRLYQSKFFICIKSGQYIDIISIL